MKRYLNDYLFAFVVLGILAAILNSAGCTVRAHMESSPTDSELPTTRSVETVTFVSDGEKWIRIWDLETGVVCYHGHYNATSTSKANACAFTPEKPYPLRNEKERP